MRNSAWIGKNSTTFAENPLVTIGAHTVNHVMLAKVTERTARSEMEMSRAVIEASLGRRPDHLAYPIGDPTAAGPREFRIAAELGFKTAVTTRPGVIFPAHRNHMTALPRISLNGEHQQMRYVRVLRSGAATAMWERLPPHQRGLTSVGSHHPADERHRRQHPREPGDREIDELDHAVRLDDRELRHRHRDDRPDRHQQDERDRADQFANADGHVRRFGCRLRRIAIAGPRLYGSRRLPQVTEPSPNSAQMSRACIFLLAALRRAVRLWLWAMAALVFAMVVVGGATRLTESGLSITEWQPVAGALPPLSAADWQAEFEKYKTIPQYQQLNRGMSLEAFKVIYWWEWTHRLLGRVIGIVFLLPFLWFLWRGAIAPPLRMRLAGIFVLGAIQGAVGWWMVASGLADRVEVSQYRLAFHLTLASMIFAALIFAAESLSPRPMVPVPKRINAGARALVGLVLVQIYLGALVAGLRAGLLYNTWPLIDGRFVPSPHDLLFNAPWWRNIFENPLTVQFDHRMVAFMGC